MERKEIQREHEKEVEIKKRGEEERKNRGRQRTKRERNEIWDELFISTEKNCFWQLEGKMKTSKF